VSSQKNNIDDMPDTFTKDTAKKTNLTARTIQQDLQLAKDLDDEVVELGALPKMIFLSNSASQSVMVVNHPALSDGDFSAMLVKTVKLCLLITGRLSND
jgi:hypothetical protein